MEQLKLIDFEAQRATREQEEYLEEFLRSKCDIFSSADFQFYADKTGKSLEWIKENANYSDPDGIYGTCLENAMLDGDYELAEMLY